MSAHLTEVSAQANSIPLLDASSLPSDDDWALIESINAYTSGVEFEPDGDRFGRFRLTASYDE